MNLYEVRDMMFGRGVHRSEVFTDIICDGALMTLEAQTQFTKDHAGYGRYQFSMADGVIQFGTKEEWKYRFQCLGSTGPGPRTWLWQWANREGFNTNILEAADAVRAFGERYQVPELTTAEWPFDDDDKLGLNVGYPMSIAGALVARNWFVFPGEFGGGSRAWLLIEGVQLSPPSTIRTMQVITEGLATGVIRDHQRAVSSYAALRGLGWDGNVLTLPDGTITIQFDEHHRLTNLTASRSPDPGAD